MKKYACNLRPGIHRGVRRGAALVEAAVVIPVMLMLIGIVVDYSRVFYHATTMDGSARNGALYEVDPITAYESDYASSTQAALADATNITEPVTVSKTTSTVNGNTNVAISVKTTFKPVVRWGILPAQTVVTRTVIVQQAPLVPDEP
jgi:Flp pilus assembly protein TadG